MKPLLKAALAGLISTAIILPVTSFAFQDGDKKVEKVDKNQRFKDTDSNGDGAIDMTEFMAQSESRRHKRGKNGRGRMGMTTGKDTNNDGNISREEFSKPALERAVGRLSKKLNMHFDELDRNEDGQLSKAEQERPMLKRFKAMDQNDDGKLSPEELMKSRHGMRSKGKRGEGRMKKRQMMRKKMHNKAQEGQN